MTQEIATVIVDCDLNSEAVFTKCILNLPYTMIENLNMVQIHLLPLLFRFQLSCAPSHVLFFDGSIVNDVRGLCLKLNRLRD